MKFDSSYPILNEVSSFNTRAVVSKIILNKHVDCGHPCLFLDLFDNHLWC